VDQQEKITVRQLAETAHLKMEVVAGVDGLDRLVEWTHVSELEDPARWLDGGELLITNGMGLSEQGAAQALLVEQLHDKRAAGLAVGIRGPEPGPEMLAAADRLGFPLLRVPKSVPFLAIARLVADSNEDTARRRLTTHLRIFDTLGAETDNPARLFHQLEDIAGYRLNLVSSNGRPLLPGMAEPEAAALEMLSAGLPKEQRETPAVKGGFVVPVPVGHRTAAFLVAEEKDKATPAGLGAVRHIATLAALELAKLYRDRESSRRQGLETLTKLLTGTIDASSAVERLRDAGFEPGEEFVIAAMRGSGEEIDDEEIHHRLCDLAAPHFLLRERDDLYVAAPDEVGLFESAVDGLDIDVGVSQPFVDDWALARKESVWALERSRMSSDEGGMIVRFSESESVVHWLPADVNALEELVNRILGPIIRYDEEHVSGMMLESLSVYFANDRRLQVSAAKLNVHKHTLAYRLRRIEEITGRDLTQLSDTVQLWLALRGHDIIAHHQHT
jgi:PucR family transcriptional regulator, purine catabolism regulatory protein